MSSIRKNARIAGFLYLLLVIAAPFRLIYVPSTLFVSGNATATAQNIAAHELLFRLGIVSDLFCGSLLIFLVLALYRLFKEVDQSHATLMVILGGVLPGAIYFFNVVNDAAALMLVRGADFLSVLEQPQRDALPCCFCVCMARRSLPLRPFGGYGCSPWQSSFCGRASYPDFWASG